jgi:hypothetical protein
MTLLSFFSGSLSSYFCLLTLLSCCITSSSSIPARSQNEVPLLYSSLSTHRSTYPVWVLLLTSPIPTVLKRSDLRNELCQALLSSNHAVAVPPLVNDIADSLGWLLWEAPFPLAVLYATIAINLHYVCECNNNGHIHPFEAHFELTMVTMGNIMLAFLPSQYDNAVNMLRFYLGECWGHRISFAGFKDLLCNSYAFIISVSFNYAFILLPCFIYTNVMFSFHFLFFFQIFSFNLRLHLHCILFTIRS